MYLRFSTKIWDKDSTRKLGILVVAHDLRDNGDLDANEHEYIRRSLKWFNEQLKIPKILEEDENRRAISWFKPGAKEPIKRMWKLTEFLKSHGIEVDVYKTTDPGNVIY